MILRAKTLENLQVLENAFFAGFQEGPNAIQRYPSLSQTLTRRRMARERRGAESSYGDTILRDNILLKMYYRQTRRVVSRQYITSTRQ